jgi:predicted metalloprotease with PDZ domain
VPNALPFTGDYDWFFEGFTLYQALRSAVRLRFIDFQEYLSTMSRVYDSYLGASDRDGLSLVEASQRRWTTAASLVYDKGMLVAFLCDLKLRRESNNRRSLDDVYKEIFGEKRRGAGRADGNVALINLLNRQSGSEQFTGRYISTAAAINLESGLQAYGLMIESYGQHSHLVVNPNLNNEQRRLLGSLGYRKPRQ